MVAAACAVMFISACGGGGGSSSPPAAAPGISVSPSPLAFPAQTVVTPSAAQVITVTNSGNAELSVTGVTVTGANAAGFSQTNTCTSNVAPGATCAISVTFTPTVGGAASAAINIASNASASPTVVPVSGALTVLNFSTFQAASVVIGAPDFVTVGSGAATATTMSTNTGSGSAVSPNGRHYLSDSANHRILGYNTVPTANGASADFVLGQTNFTSGTAGSSQSTLQHPAGVAIYNNHLLVADYDNNRVLIWNSLPSSNDALPDVVVGQANFTTNASGCTATTLFTPLAVAVVNGNLAVLDAFNNRVLLYQGIPTANNAAAVNVLGQSSLTSCPAAVNPPTSSSLFYPRDVLFDGTHLWVADSRNSRVLAWNTTNPIALPTAKAADMVLGQADFISNTTGVSSTALNFPAHLAFDVITGRFAVEDEANNRVLIWHKVPTCSATPCVITTPADVVLGQSNFTSNVANAVPGTGATGNAVPSANGLNYPFGVYLNGPNQLIVIDADNNRELIFDAK